MSFCLMGSEKVLLLSLEEFDDGPPRLDEAAAALSWILGKDMECGGFTNWRRIL